MEDSFDQMTERLLEGISRRSRELFPRPVFIGQSNDDDGFSVFTGNRIHHVSVRRPLWFPRRLVSTQGVCGRSCKPWMALFVHDEAICQIVKEEVEKVFDGAINIYIDPIFRR